VPALSGIDAAAAQAVVRTALEREEAPWLQPQEVGALLGAFGITAARSIVTRSPEEAASAWRSLGKAAALKLISSTILHKTDVGGVKLGIRSAEAATEAYRAMQASMAAQGLADGFEGVLVQEMVEGGVECLAGIVNDPQFGPLIAFGLGGTLAEVMGDVGFRLHPLTDVDADELLGSLKASRLLAGYRGAPPADLAALRDLLLRVSRLAEEVPQIAELDLNPVIALPQGRGVSVLDARVRLQSR
jgi:acyl-CoA synthetase (NDP forming)